MARYYVYLQVVYPVEVSAESEEEAIQKAMDDCPYDNAAETDPVVEKAE